MKKTVLLLFVTLILNSCSQSINFNKVAYQGLKNNFFWEAAEYEAKLAANGSIIIRGKNLTDAMVVYLNAAGKGTYTLGVNNSVKAIYTESINGTLSTFDTTLSRSGGPDGTINGVGKIQITANDGVTISGTFEFDAVNVDPLSDQVYVNFKKGAFNNIPITKL
jgi:Family of unknown function (DUF6252)